MEESHIELHICILVFGYRVNVFLSCLSGARVPTFYLFIYLFGVCGYLFVRLKVIICSCSVDKISSNFISDVYYGCCIVCRQNPHEVIQNTRPKILLLNFFPAWVKGHDLHQISFTVHPYFSCNLISFREGQSLNSV